MHTLQEHIEVGVIQKVFLCVRGGVEGSNLPSWFWPTHEIYFLLIILIIPGTLMMIAYGNIVKKIYECMEERNPSTTRDQPNDTKSSNSSEM